MEDLTLLSQDALDELFAAHLDDAQTESIKAEYVRRGIDPETGEPVAA